MADVLVGGSDRPRWPRRRWLAAALVTALVAVGVLVVRGDDPPPAAPAAAATPTVEAPADAHVRPLGPCPFPATGLVVTGAPAEPGATIESCDRTAGTGPWTVVVRRADGSLARHGAVVTFPVEEPTTPRVVRVGRVLGRIGAGTVTWPIAGAYARVRGDLTEAEMVALAEGTAVDAGRPVVDPPRSLAVVWTGPYRPPVVSQVRYDSTELGEQAALGNGLAYTGVAAGGGIEDQLRARHARRAGLVGGRPALVSSVYGGNATLIWELAPGVVAFVGYSGTGQPPRATTALLRLVARARVLTRAEWRATGPQVVDQVNEPT